MRSKLAKIFAVIVTLTLIIQIPLFMKSPIIPAEFKDPEHTAYALIADDKKFDDLGHKLEVKPITGTDGIPVFSSVAVTELGESGLKTKNYQSEGVVNDTLFSADSMTKMITAATILRMTEEEKYQQFLPKGIETKLSDLLPLLKKHYPDSTYILFFHKLHFRLLCRFQRTTRPLNNFPLLIIPSSLYYMLNY
jgi:hypothetical protein